METIFKFSPTKEELNRMHIRANTRTEREYIEYYRNLGIDDDGIQDFAIGEIINLFSIRGLNEKLQLRYAKKIKDIRLRTSTLLSISGF